MPSSDMRCMACDNVWPRQDVQEAGNRCPGCGSGKLRDVPSLMPQAPETDDE